MKLKIANFTLMAERKLKFGFSDRFILLVIILNSVIIFLQEGGHSSGFINVLDATCTIIFLLEMIVKHCKLGFKGYWSSAWNRLDGILVILSLPSLISYVVPAQLLDLSILLILRVLRVFRFFRLIHIFPNFGKIVKNLWRAIKDSVPIFAGFLILIIVFALFSCALFKDISPQYFGTPLDSIYSTFRLCTVEGWYDIPDSLSKTLGPGQIAWVRIYFIIILIAGGIIGLSLVNSIFVDAMVSDNNDELEKEVATLNDKIDALTEEIKKLQDTNKKL